MEKDCFNLCCPYNSCNVMREVEFIQDFATKKKGDKHTYDGMLASQLVRVDKVAKYTDLPKKK